MRRRRHLRSARVPLTPRTATEVRAELPWCTNCRKPVPAFIVVSDHDRLAWLLSIAGAHTAHFRLRRNAPRTTRIHCDLRALIVNWLLGTEIAEIGVTHLGWTGRSLVIPCSSGITATSGDERAVSSAR
jgi:hypothetical protein